MRRRNGVPSWLLAGIVATALILGPRRAHASDWGENLPILVFVTAFTVTMVVLAINFPHDDEADKTATTETSTSESALGRGPRAASPGRGPLGVNPGRAPRRTGPLPSAPGLGFSGRF